MTTVATAADTGDLLADLLDGILNCPGDLPPELVGRLALAVARRAQEGPTAFPDAEAAHDRAVFGFGPLLRHVKRQEDYQDPNYLFLGPDGGLPPFSGIGVRRELVTTVLDGWQLSRNPIVDVSNPAAFTAGWIAAYSIAQALSIHPADDGWPFP